MTYRILSFDGGGVRGIYAAQLLSMLAKEFDFLKNIDLFVGTSTGSFIALGLSSRFSPEDLVEFYHQFARVTFSVDKNYDPLSDLCPKYQMNVLKELMELYVFKSNPTLADLDKKVVIPAFKLYDELLGRWKPHYFHNFGPDRGKSNKVIDVALSSGSAPIFFPSYQGYIDGGVFANNPSMVGLCQAMQHDQDLPILSNICMLSIGTGIQSFGITKEVTWGAKGWLGSTNSPPYPLFSIVTDGVADAAHDQCKQILGKNYHRLNTLVDSSIAIDDWKEMPRLIEIAKAVPKEHPKLWKETVDWIKTCF